MSTLNLFLTMITCLIGALIVHFLKQVKFDRLPADEEEMTLNAPVALIQSTG